MHDVKQPYHLLVVFILSSVALLIAFVVTGYFTRLKYQRYLALKPLKALQRQLWIEVDATERRKENRMENGNVEVEMEPLMKDSIENIVWQKQFDKSLEVEDPVCKKQILAKPNREAKLGEGNNGKVYKRDIILNGLQQTVAVKSPLKVDIKNFTEMVNELNALCYLRNHVNIVQLVCAITKEIEKGRLCLCLELCEKGSLLDLLQASRPFGIDTGCVSDRWKYPTIETHTLIGYLAQIANGICYIHAKGVVHRDPAARNVLITINDTAKISDLAKARPLQGTISGTATQVYVPVRLEKREWPIRWMAPETLNQMEDPQFTKFSDSWGFGILMHETLSDGAEPYEQIEVVSLICQFL